MCIKELLLLIILDGVECCNEKMCLTWYKQRNELVLVCDVQRLNGEIVFVNDQDEDIAYCTIPYPFVHCFTSLNSGTITQDIRYNRTTLRIKYQENHSIDGKWTCFYKGYHQSAIVTMKNHSDILDLVWLKGSVVNSILTLECRVQSLAHDINIYAPKGNLFGTCSIKKNYENQIVNCNGDKNITFDSYKFSVNVFVKSNKSFGIYGVWRCTQYANGEDSFYLEKQDSTGSCNHEVYQTVIIVLGCFCFSFIGYMIKKAYLNELKIPRKTKRSMFREENAHLQFGDGEETFFLLQGSDEILKHSLCMTCQHLTAFAFCPACGGFYCESCFEQHNFISDHKLIQIELISGIDHSTKCTVCDTLSTRVCITCEKLFCDSCSCNHEHKSLLLKSAVRNRKSTVRNFTIGVEMTELYKVNLSKNNSHQHYDSDPTEKPGDNKSEENLHVRVFGFAFLSSDRFLVGDSHNRTLKVFQKHLLNFSFSLDKEPRGLAALYGDKVAVTFPHLQLIKKYDITEKCILDSERDINLQGTGKPFKIAYNQDVFAVEINENEDGFIAILSFEGEVLYRIKEATKYAYFTGHTLTLDLDKFSESVFITAMSKNSVTCLDFSGNKKWSKPIPSPSGVCFIPPGKLLVASKRGNAIYKVNTKTGNNDIIAAMGVIQSPRYITYDQMQKILYVHVLDENDYNCIVTIKYNMLA